MGAAKCSQCSQFCEVGKEPPPHQWAQGLFGGVTDDGISGLSYTPLPPADSNALLESLLGSALPQKPRSWATGAHHSLQLGLSTSSRDAGGPNYGRPGDPVNKVYVEFSNDLEGFLPYTLVISEDQGLEFTSLSSSPDFQLNPLNVIKTQSVSYDELMQDAFFMSLSKSVLERPELWPGGQASASALSGRALPKSLEERVRPPYLSLVQLSVRRTILEGGQVLVFIAVQSDSLAGELLRSCEQLRRRRAVRHMAFEPTRSEVFGSSIGGSSPRSGMPSRGCPTPRSVAAAAGRHGGSCGGGPPAGGVPPPLSPRQVEGVKGRSGGINILPPPDDDLSPR
mmetsp:Transcript_128962/g.413031  ORF Transcript_128962/g.413031 Transcript_128962/m.413031 type:complete len:339 (-) Transcript_128962:72-1088(-)